MLKQVNITDEHTKQIHSILMGVIPKFPKGGTQGVYMPQLFEKMNHVKSGNAIRLFFALVLGANEFGIVVRTREQLCQALKIRYDRSNISRLLAILEEDKLIMKFSNSYLINPFLVLPTVTDVKMKSALQELWTANEFQ